jgi:hypothetical protein
MTAAVMTMSDITEKEETIIAVAETMEVAIMVPTIIKTEEALMRIATGGIRPAMR